MCGLKMETILESSPLKYQHFNHYLLPRAGDGKEGRTSNNVSYKLNPFFYKIIIVGICVLSSESMLGPH